MAWKTRAAVAVLAAAATTALAAPQAADSGDTNIKVPEAPREFRAAWVATVSNIDWPSRRGLSTEEQQSELVAILDRLRDLNMNAAILQIRPAADALYKSDLEPWSEYLTGEQGKAPEPFYDPLQFAVDEAHKRGIEMHVWFNPYRARLLKSDKSSTSGFSAPPSAPNHISVTNPEVVKTYGGFQWMDPGEKIVQDRSLAVILDVVRRYDIDGIHMDDYFYPYPISDPVTKKEIDFPDDPSWNRYKQGGGKLSRSDWRRQNVDQFIQRLYTGVKKEKPKVLVGLSPFGIWKPGFPESVKGFNQYEKLYADAKLWLNRGWIDYWTPQLYWRIQDLSQSYPTLLKWWMEENTKKRHMWPGLFLTKPTFGPDEIINQIVITRFLGATGHVHFSMKGFIGEGKLNERLTTATGIYATPAIIPATNWLGGQAPGKPTDLQVSSIGTTETAAVDFEAGYIPAAQDTTETEPLSDAPASTGTETATEPVPAGGATTAVQELAPATEATTATAEVTPAPAADAPTAAGEERSERRGRRSRRGAQAAPAPTVSAPEKPATPRKKVELSWKAAGKPEDVRVYAVHAGSNVAGSISWKFYVVPGSQTSLQIEADEKGNFPAYYAVSAVGELGLASPNSLLIYKPALGTQGEAQTERYGQVQ